MIRRKFQISRIFPIFVPKKTFCMIKTILKIHIHSYYNFTKRLNQFFFIFFQFQIQKSNLLILIFPHNSINLCKTLFNEIDSIRFSTISRIYCLHFRQANRNQATYSLSIRTQFEHSNNNISKSFV